MNEIKERLKKEYEEYRLPYTKFEDGILWINDNVLPYYSWIEKKYIEAEKPNAVLGEVQAIYDELLEEAMYLYQYYPNNFRKTVEEYFKKEIEMQKRISEHFS